jgi:hypothetical protein
MALNSRRIRRTTGTGASVPGHEQVFRPCDEPESHLAVGYATPTEMISGVHTLIFNKDADAVRAFFRGQPRHPTAIQPRG